MRSGTARRFSTKGSSKSSGSAESQSELPAPAIALADADATAARPSGKASKQRMQTAEARQGTSFKLAVCAHSKISSSIL
eukprot:6186709-Pleurochrysis_carterae.AAC.9